MMFDIYGYPHSTVEDYDIHPAWTEYYVTWKKWLKSLSSHDFQMMKVKEIVKKKMLKLGNSHYPFLMITRNHPSPQFPSMS